MKSYFPVNSLAPKDDKLTVYFKKVGEKKSDGFAVIENGSILVIDVGQTDDVALVDHLLDLRKSWLEGYIGADDLPKRLEIAIVVSHAHPDHMASLPLLLEDQRFCVTALYAPNRAYLGGDVEGALPPLVKYENKLSAMCDHLDDFAHVAKEITRIPYGKVYPLNFGSKDTTVELYPSQFDWSEDRPSDKEGFRFILTNNSPTYKDRPQNGYTNGILNGNSLWVKITKHQKTVLITGDQRASDEMMGSMIRHYGENTFKCHVLKIPHHGESNYSPYLLSVADPDFTVFTTSYEKATRETVELCEEMGAVNFYTCDGDLFFTLDENCISPSGIDPR